MRNHPLLALLLALVCSAACAEEPDPARYGYRRVAVSTVCPEPHRTWALEAVPKLDDLGREQWLVAGPGDAVDVTVTCRAFPSICSDDPARCDAVGSYQEGDHFVEFDPERTRDPYMVHKVVMHELIHERIYRGPSPVRARAHVCRLVNQLPGDACYSGWHGEAIMNPDVGADGRPNSAWNDIVGTVALDIVQPGDVAFYRWALSN